ncbi:L-type lectin-domain containing receptor kinase IX.1-like [Miscanthus floridulus]|uniref:L-type lectin-domain containing receptor kinase IX.1-like n=1 Tax=Miscanthus floridulus TaxID=154761 RepID=UPI003457887A
MLEKINGVHDEHRRSSVVVASRRRHLVPLPDVAVVRLLLLLAVVVVVVGLLPPCAADDDEEPYLPLDTICPASSNFIAGTVFEANLDILVHRLTAAAAAAGGFYNDSYSGRSSGPSPSASDEVFGFVMCTIDSSWQGCQKCLDTAPSYLLGTACPKSRMAAVMYGDCILRYSDQQPFFNDETDRGRIFFTAVTDTFADVIDARWELMKRLIAEAASSPLRFANGSQAYNEGRSDTYGVVQCRRDFDPTHCTECLNYQIQKLLTSYPNNTVASARGYSCYARYQADPFDTILVPPADLPSPPSKKDARLPLIIGLEAAAAASGILFLLSLSIQIWLFSRWWQKRIDKDDMEEKFVNGAGPKRFCYNVLAAATGNFSDEQKLGEGGFGSVYRGILAELNLHVAIKRVSKGSRQGRKEYAAEVTIISRLRHRNLVQLIGWCHSHEELLLVYELMPNGSLDAHLYIEERMLPWSLRYDIILGIGSALLYLHQDCEQGVLHRDIKPSNVMLDASFNAKLGDFGLARLVDHGQGPHTTELAGTMGYMDPECMITGRFSTESDIYSFGVVLLEVACGRQPVRVLQHNNTAVHLTQPVSELYERGTILDAADPRLNENFDAREMECVLVVGLWCTQQDRSLRPSIRQAASALRFEASLPTLSSTPPVGRRLSSIPSFNVEMVDSTANSSTHL